jgi:hypothetical protein
MDKIPGIFERPPASGIYWVSCTDTIGMRRREKAGKLGAALDLLASRRLHMKTQGEEHSMNIKIRAGSQIATPNPERIYIPLNL